MSQKKSGGGDEVFGEKPGFLRSAQAFLDYLSTQRQIWWGHLSHNRDSARRRGAGLVWAVDWADSIEKPRAHSSEPAASSQGPDRRAHTPRPDARGSVAPELKKLKVQEVQGPQSAVVEHGGAIREYGEKPELRQHIFEKEPRTNVFEIWPLEINAQKLPWNIKFRNLPSKLNVRTLF